MPRAPARARFRGIDYFPIDPQWRVVADWYPVPAPRAMVLLTSIGTPQPLALVGSAEFVLRGRRYKLQILRDFPRALSARRRSSSRRRSPPRPGDCPPEPAGTPRAG
ncbi:DUF1684 domain-containing protein [Xanthomonas sp. LMG 12462]|uniref:DUF1684 domain-containing protein n=1 Tax=Xanthomonas sp. LMG 12462 TaxID=1591134 RepID=UPI001D03EBB0|nr:DUF1684 domain-containing protein [Xanthomonas sp. LMG 12462]